MSNDHRAAPFAMGVGSLTHRTVHSCPGVCDPLRDEFLEFEIFEILKISKSEIFEILRFPEFCKFSKFEISDLQKPSEYFHF